MGPLNWSSYFPCYESCREGIWGWGSRCNGCRKGNRRISCLFCISVIPHKLFLCWLIRGCYRANWGKLAHIQITGDKLFSTLTSSKLYGTCLWVPLGLKWCFWTPYFLRLFYFLAWIDWKNVIPVLQLSAALFAGWNKICGIPWDVAGGYVEDFEGLKLGLLSGTPGATEPLLPVANSPWSEPSPRLLLGILERPRVPQNML